MKKKKIKIIALIVLLIVVGVIGVTKLKPKDNENDIIQNNNNLIVNENKENEAQKDKTIYIAGTKMIGNVEVTNIKLTPIENMKWEFTADIKNTAMDYFPESNIRIKLKDKSGNDKQIFGAGIPKLIPMETEILKTIVLANITSVEDVEFEVISSEKE